MVEYAKNDQLLTDQSTETVADLGEGRLSECLEVEIEHGGSGGGKCWPILHSNRDTDDNDRGHDRDESDVAKDGDTREGLNRGEDGGDDRGDDDKNDSARSVEGNGVECDRSRQHSGAGRAHHVCIGRGESAALIESRRKFRRLTKPVDTSEKLSANGTEQKVSSISNRMHLDYRLAKDARTRQRKRALTSG